MFAISVLGPTEVRRNGQLVAVPAGKTSELLVRLAIEPGVIVRTDRLVEDLWGRDAVNTRRNTLQAKVVKLRRALGAPNMIVSADGGYRLAVEDSQIDAVRVGGAVAEASSLFDSGDDHGAAAVCASTLELFRGDVLAGAGDGDWAMPHRARLEAARLHLVETRCAARVRLGELVEVIDELEAAVIVFPYQERLWALLITALYRVGRQADAVDAYQRVRRRLADELGLEPGAQLQRLEHQVLTQHVSLASSDAGLVSPSDAPVGNLPTMTTELIGRSGELAALTGLLVSQRLVEIVGPGGVGKTAVAIAAARSSTVAGGVWLARLETATTADEVLDAVLAAMGVTGGRAALYNRLRSRATLVVLDNCEHVVDAAADLVQRLLDAAPLTTILCTTQVALGIDGQTLFELEPLTLDASVELFTRRASAHRKNDELDQASRPVHELCRSLDGLPLAIELAAARTKTLSISEISRRLDHRFDILSDPTSRRPERRRALKATIRWSYDLLFPDDQRGLWALATFAGGAPLGAAEHVLQALDVPARAAIDVLGRLTSRSLVIVDEAEAPAPRFRLLDSIRAFAVEEMSGAGAADVAHAAHAGWFAEMALDVTDGIRSSRQPEHLAFARNERANLDAALTWCAARDPLLGLAIANGFGWSWIILGDSRGARRILAALDAAGSAAPAPDRATALLLAAWLETSTGNLEQARQHIGHAADIADTIGDVELQARSAYHLAYVMSHHGDYRSALELTDRSRSVYAGLDRPWDIAANALLATRAATSAGDTRRAVEEAASGRDLLQRVDDPWLHVRFDTMLGELARLERRFDDAVEHFSRAAATSRRLGYLQAEAYQVTCLGRAQCQAGDYPEGAASLQLAIAKANTTGDPRMAALAQVHLGRVLRALGHDEAARRALEQAAAWHRTSGGGEQAVLGECLLAALDARDGVPGAPERLAAVLAIAAANDNAAAEVFALDALARGTAARGDTELADELQRRADARMASASHFITELDRTDALARGA